MIVPFLIILFLFLSCYDDLRHDLHCHRKLHQMQIYGLC